MNSFQPVSRPARIASGLVGMFIGLGLVAATVHGLGARSGGQSLGQFVASQRAVAEQPLARAAVPAAAPVAEVVPDAI